jgi:hypothetical protein
VPPHERCSGTPGALYCGQCGAAKFILDRHLEQRRPLDALAMRAALVCKFCDEANTVSGLRGPLATQRARLAAQAKGRS